MYNALSGSVILYVNANAMWCIPTTGILVSKPWAEPEFALASFPSLFTRKYYDDSLYWLIWEKKRMWDKTMQTPIIYTKII